MAWPRPAVGLSRMLRMSRAQNLVGHSDEVRMLDEQGFLKAPYRKVGRWLRGMALVVVVMWQAACASSVKC